jgi:NAD+ diphosphatase
MFSALAGFVEPGETPESAVVREVFEETGIKVHNTKYIGAQPWAFPNSLMLGFTGEALSDQITLDAELDDALWITREDMVQVMAGTHPVVKKPRPGAIAHDLVSRWLAGTI